MSDEAPIVARALALLGKHDLVLALHDPSFPAAPGQDTGRGSPYSAGARAFLAFAAGLGFTGVQFGPQGQTSASNASPYDGTIFARNTLSIDLHALAHDPQWLGILSPTTWARLVADADPGPHVHHRHVHAAYTAALAEAHAGLLARHAALAAGALDVATAAATTALLDRLARFGRHHRAWLERDALHAALAQAHGEDWREWPAELRRPRFPAPELTAVHRAGIARFAFQQFIAHEQHEQLRRHTDALGLKVYGDLQIGVSTQDRWSHHSLFLGDYRMGAPPSRTNPDGQPWGYPVLDPAQYHDPRAAPGPVLEFMSLRVGKLLAEFDGLRLDHPHGLVCPWVYRADDPDPLHAVQTGARLFSSPHIPDHPGLARYAIARPEQLAPDPRTPRHADDWVRALDDAQVDAYSAILDTVLAAAQAHGRARSDILCEVLSTQPYPLFRVMQRHGLGRFRVTQKADLSNPADVYRSENAAPPDWIMVGNHDTPTIWQLVDRWHHSGEALAQARYLAARLAPDGADVDALADTLAADPHRLAQAKFADIFASPARHVQIFYADLLGEKYQYNLPGTVNDLNWSYRIPADYAQRHAARRRERSALDLPGILAMALRRRDQPDSRERHDVLAVLDVLAALDARARAR
jgi:4-alpha-glucanotransferase